MAFGKQDNQAPGEYGQPQAQSGVVAPINRYNGSNTDPSNLSGSGPAGQMQLEDTSQSATATANGAYAGRGMLGDFFDTVGKVFSGIGKGGGNYEEATKREAEESQRINRPNISTPTGSYTWERAPDGTLTLRQGYTPELQGLNASLQQQAAAMGGPMDWGQFGTLPTGEAARQQAIDAAYGQSTSRLNPFFQQREESERARLINSGIAEGSEAYNNAMGALSRERNDAYQGAMNAAIGQGAQAGQAIFQQGLQGRQQAISEALRRRGQPLQELAQLQGLNRQPTVNPVMTPQLLAAFQGQQGADADAINAWVQAGASILPYLFKAGG